MSSTLWRSRRRGERPPIYGRERERAQLRELLDDAIAGHGCSLVLISGEAGIGKTTLVEDLIHEAEQRNCHVLTGGCYDLTTTPPFGPWIEALRRYSPSDEDLAVPIWFGNPDELEKIRSQALLFHETEHFFRELANQRLLLIVLEDLHWSDSASLDLLRHLSRTLAGEPILIVATYRDDELTRRHELYQLLPLLVRESPATRVHLNRIDRDILAVLIEDRCALTKVDTERLATYLQERSEGNPFFANELLQGLEEDGVLRQTGDAWVLGDLTIAHIPPLLRSVIERRLGRLSNETRQLLEIASVIGQRVSFALWSEVSRLDERDLIDAVAEGRRAQLIDESPERRGIQFRHALVREALYEAIIGVELRSWHRQIGEALAERDNADPDRVAHHFNQAGDDRQVEWLLRAGERAERSYAWRAAAAHYETVVRVLEGNPSQVVERGWLLYRISDIQRWTDAPRALRYAEEARRIGEEAGDHWLAALAGQRVGFHRSNTRPVGSRLGDVIVEMIVSCEAVDAGVRAYWQGSDDPGWQLSIERVPTSFLAVAEYLDVNGMAEDAPLNMGWGAVILRLNWAGRLVETRRLGEAMLPLATWALEQVELTAATLYYADLKLALAYTYANLGRIERARRMFAETLDAARRYEHHVMSEAAIIGPIIFVELPYFADDPQRRWELLAEATEYQERARGSILTIGASALSEARIRFIEGDPLPIRHAAGQILSEDASWTLFQEASHSLLAWVDVVQGKTGQAWQHTQKVLVDGPATAPGNTGFDPATSLQLLAAHLTLDAGELDEARAWLEAHDRWMDWSGTVPGRAEGQLGWARYHRVAGDLDQARIHAERADAHASNPRQPLALIAVERFLGQLDVDKEQYDDAEARLAPSLELAERCQAPYEQALTLVVMAERAAKMGKADETRELIARAREICVPLDAKPTLERLDEIEAMISATQQDAPTYPAGLTEREVEVLRLVVEGMTDGEIAEELYLSPRTISTYLSSIYTKLGVNSRAAAAAITVRSGLA